MERVICFVDGFNLYHAIVKTKRPHHKWINLRALSSVFISSKTQVLIDVLYFSSYAFWLADSQKRHKQYVKAISAFDVKCVMGKFKSKEKTCRSCNFQWKGHEEKQSDVNIALHLLLLAQQDKYDHAFLISNDSDLVPAIKMVREHFPKKLITTIAPPLCIHSNELIHVASRKSKIQVDHLDRCLLPEIIYDASGEIIAARPKEYTPPIPAFSTFS